MKREDLKNTLIQAGIQEDKINSVVDYVMKENGDDINKYKSELETLKGKYADDIKAKDDSIKGYEDKLKGFSDYEELKKYKADSIANAEKNKKIDFLKSLGCKHPDLIIDKVDFSKATYDEEKKAYTGLDEAIKGLKTNYAELFESKAPQQLNPDIKPKTTESDFMAEYRKNNPNLKI